MLPLDHVVEQLWAPALLRSPDLRVVVDTSGDSTWMDVERYWLVPSASSARLLVPWGPRNVAARLLTNYRSLRTREVNAGRLVLGAATRAGVPLSRSTVAVQVRRSAPEAVRQLPLAMLSEAMGQSVFAATGVRTGDNRKTTLHLVDGEGRPVGYAKIGWTPATDHHVANEGRVLREIGGHLGPTRAPRLIAELDYHGHPVIVTSPLPLDARGSLSTVEQPTAQEMYWLTPVSRQAPPAQTLHFQAMSARLGKGVLHDRVRPVIEPALDLVAELSRIQRRMPVTARWHGDLTPWNRARDGSGQLWVWDWESSEDDALAGLDALHWVFASHRLRRRGNGSASLQSCLDGADGHLAAAGIARSDRPVVAATYALAVVDRACGFAIHADTWNDAYVGPAGLLDLVQQGLALLRRGT